MSFNYNSSTLNTLSGTSARRGSNSSGRSGHSPGLQPDPGWGLAYSPRSPRSPGFNTSNLPNPAPFEPEHYQQTMQGMQHGRARHSSPVLLHPLPPTLVLEKESKAQSELELDRQAAQRKRERELAEALQDEKHRVERIQAKEGLGTWSKMKTGKGKGKDGGEEGPTSSPFARPPQAYELYQAIDKHNIDFIARVRDHAFNLLLQKNAGEFPVIYAARWGAQHRDIVILLVGAFSRYVNHLSEEDFKKKEVQNTLKMLRANLKLAIDNALLPSSQSNLLSSYLQVLIMSEGDSWVHKATNDLGLLLRDADSTPVAEAEVMVRRFSTKELRGVPGGVGDVEEYIANAALDLVIMSAWGVASTQMDVEPLPTYTFARDLRTYTLFTESMEANQDKLNKVSRRVRSILNTLKELAGDNKKGVRGRLRDVKEAIDKT